MLQSSTIQEGGKKSSNRRNTRLLQYKLKNNEAELEAEYVVQLPILASGKVAGQSEIHYISDTQFLVLARDGGAGHGQVESESKYRNADVIDISKATNIKGKKNDAFDGAIASSKGVLNSDVTPAVYCPWLSYNNNTQLNRFGVHNGGAQDAGLLNEKWESFALAPVDGKFATKGKGEGDEYYLISFSDDDFITQNGMIASPLLYRNGIDNILQATSTEEKTSTLTHLALTWTTKYSCSRSGCQRVQSHCENKSMIDRSF
jgi:hypothetical protein